MLDVANGVVHGQQGHSLSSILGDLCSGRSERAFDLQHLVIEQQNTHCIYSQVNLVRFQPTLLCFVKLRMSILNYSAGGH